MRTFIFLLGIFFCGIMQAQVGLEWAARIGGLGSEEGNSISIDSEGNIYTIGAFQGTVDFDPGTGIYNLVSSGDYDIFVSKFNVLGTLIWAKKLGGLYADFGNSIIVDTMGNIYITGRFFGTADFDPGVGIFNLTASGWNDVFVSKLDTSGTLIWAKKLGGTNPDKSYSIALDPTGNVYTVGIFQGTVDFDPGAGIVNLTSAGSYDVFISKLDTSGAFVWAKRLGGVFAEMGSDIVVDVMGNIYTTGTFQGTADFDPDTGVVNMTSNGGYDIFISKLNSLGALVWTKSIGGTNTDESISIAVDAIGNVYTTGCFQGVVDFNPNAGLLNFTSLGISDAFISKLDSLGNFVWTKQISGTGNDCGKSIEVDMLGNVYTIGIFQGMVDLDQGAMILNFTSLGGDDIFVSKLDAAGNCIWAQSLGSNNTDNGNSIKVDILGNIYAIGGFQGTTDFDFNSGITNLTAIGFDVFVVKLRQNGVTGRVFQDINQNCVMDINEGVGIERNFLIQPGNIITQTNSAGIWYIDSLPAGTYTITADTSSPNWQITCPVTQSFTVLHPDSITVAPSFGFISTNPCTSPDISIHAPFLRPGFSNQGIYVQACNSNLGTAILDSAYVIVELDPLLTVQSGSQAYTALGNNMYRVNVGDIYPGFCVDFWLSCTLSSNAVLGSTLCMNATLYPLDSCALDNDPNPYPSGTVSPCTLPWDHSSLSVEGSCVGDSVRFVIYNHGVLGGGDMDCYAPVRVYLDGAWILLDSIQLQGGDSIVFMFAGNAQTWRLEANQHPLHPGNSHPNATVENCGTGTWTPNLVNILPQDDADPQIDIYCGLVTGSYDPNDKTGYPLGIGAAHDILPNQGIEYVINFQNTGTDTAFTVVVRDTLSTDLDIFSVQSGVSSHDYDFRMYGPRVLEWTFYNIMLPDSNVNEPASHGFITFKVNQMPDLPNGTVIENSASIYFDFNAPIFTNTSWHTINDGFVFLNTEKERVEENLQVKIYPNPTTGILHINKMNHAKIQISVLDNLGRVLLSQNSNETITSLNINHLPTGIYYISINNGKEVMTQKVVKR